MFQFPALASCHRHDGIHRMPGCPIRVSADYRPFAPTRGFSQLTTPFVASVSLGIHHAPLLAFPSFSRDAHTDKNTVRAVLLVPTCQRTDAAPLNGADKVENNGLEPLTPCLQGRRSSQLS